MSRSGVKASPGLRIAAASVRVLRAEADDGIAMSFSALPCRTMVLVQLKTVDGLVGYGESWANFPSWAHVERVATLEQGVFPLIIGELAGDITELHRKLISRLEPIGRQWGAPGPIMQAVSAVDVALWDLIGKAQGRSVADIAGRVRQEVSVYASSVGPDQVREQVTHCCSAGYKAIKVRVGFGRDRDDAILATAREAGGENMLIYADANQAWDLPDAIEIAPVLIRHQVAWVEEPLRGNRLSELEVLHRRTGLNIATGENLYGREAFEAYANSPSIRILQPDVSKTGGLTEALEICQIAESRGKDVVPHLYGGAVAFAATLQLAGCVQAVKAVEYDFRRNPLRDPLWLDGPVPKRDLIAIPTEPGLGISLNEAAIARYSKETQID